MSELQTSGGSENSSSSSNIIGLASDGTDLFVARYSWASGTYGTEVSRIALQTGTLTSYTTSGGFYLSGMSGMEKIGDSLFASYSSSIYEIELTNNTTSPETWNSINNDQNGFGTYGVLGVAYGNNSFVAVGSNGKISTSPDGSNWTGKTTGTTK